MVSPRINLFPAKLPGVAFGPAPDATHHAPRAERFISATGPRGTALLGRGGSSHYGFCVEIKVTDPPTRDFVFAFRVGKS